MRNDNIRYEVLVKTLFNSEDLNDLGAIDGIDYDFWVNAHHTKFNHEFKEFYEYYSDAFEACKQFNREMNGFKIVEVLNYNNTKYSKTLYKSELEFRGSLKFKKS